MSKWLLLNKKADFKALGEQLGVDQVIVRLMVNRGLTTYEQMKDYLHPSLDTMSDSHELKDIELAAELLMDAIDEGKHIRVVGDYDVDGIMSTYILTDCIRRAGGNVDYAVPHRMIDGYGINPEIVKSAYEDGVELILTCDNGIAAREASELAKANNMTYVVTDHHEVPFELVDGEKKYILPIADAIVNPHQMDCPSTFKGICGAQVAYKLADVLYEMLGFEVDEVKRYIEFAAIACVCDVMELIGENRALVYHGINKLMHTQNIGLHCLLARNDLVDKKLACYHIGFVLGPCFNASGRLDTAGNAIELLLEEDSSKALYMAQELVELNSQRKNMTQSGIDAAIAMIEENNMTEDKVLVVYLKDLHESIAGIVAGRLKERYYRPVIVFTAAKEGAKGSGRSIEGYNMFEELGKVKHLFTKFGGHPMAAGISLPTENVDVLRAALNQGCMLTDDQMSEVVRIDVPMPFSYITPELVQSIDLLEPYGNKNPKPVFALKNVKILSANRMGSENQFLRLTICGEDKKQLTGLVFKDADGFLDYISKKYSKAACDALFSGKNNNILLDIIYQPSLNTYNGNTSVQIIIEQYK